MCMVEFNIHSLVAQCRVREVELVKWCGLWGTFGCHLLLEHQVLSIGHPKPNLATMLDDLAIIPEG